MISGDSLAIPHMSAETSGNYTCLLDNGIPGSKCESSYYQGMKKSTHMYNIRNSINEFWLVCAVHICTFMVSQIKIDVFL